MDSQNFPPVDYRSSFSNASLREGFWSSDSFYAQSLDSYRYPTAQDSTQVLKNAIVLAAGHPATFNNTSAARGYLHPLDDLGLTMRPIRGTVAVNECPNFPNCLNFPLPSQEVSRVVVPQPPYTCGNSQKTWNRSPPIPFSSWGRPGVRLSDAINGDFTRIDDRDGCPFGESRGGITIRINFPGYPSSTHVEKELKAQAEGGGKPKARSMQLSTKNYKALPEPVTKSKSVQEVSKRIQWHISDLLNNSDLFPFDVQVGEEWRLGQGRMKFEHMVITALENVSSGSWSPIIWIE